MLAYYSGRAGAAREPWPSCTSSRRAITAADKAAVKRVAERYFPAAEDGLRHSKRCDEQIAKAQGRIAEGQSPPRCPKSNETERQAREHTGTMLFEDLRAVGVVPGGMVTMAQLKALHVTRLRATSA